MVVILDRPRHDEQIERIRDHGGRIRLIPDGDVAGSLMAVWPEPASTCCGASAARRRASSPPPAIKRVGGALLGRMWPRDEDERAAHRAAGIDPDRMLDDDDLVAGETASLRRPA